METMELSESPGISTLSHLVDDSRNRIIEDLKSFLHIILLHFWSFGHCQWSSGKILK